MLSPENRLVRWVSLSGLNTVTEHNVGSITHHTWQSRPAMRLTPYVLRPPWLQSEHSTTNDTPGLFLQQATAKLTNRFLVFARFSAQIRILGVFWP